MSSAQHYPLDGIRVLDFSRAVAGPFAGRLLTDLGADVVKIEPPDGDITRIHGRKVAGISGFFNHQNAGKRNVCLNLTAPGAADLVKELVCVADIVIENYRPGVMHKLGIDYEVLSAVNSKLIMLSISGFGQHGPEASKPSYAPVVHAETGLMHRLAEYNGTAPGDLPLSIGDTNAALHGLVAVLAALYMREQSGLGQHIDMSMMDASFATDDRAHFGLEDAPNSIFAGPILELPFGPVFVTSDPEMKLVFKKLLSRGLIEDPALPGADLEAKVAARRNVVDQTFQQCETLQQFGDLMNVLDIPWGEVRDPKQLHLQPTLASRNMLVQVDDRAGGTRPMADSPYRFSGAAAGVRGPAAHQGEHNQEVLEEWLRFSQAQINDLIDSGLLVTGSSESKETDYPSAGP